MENCVSFCRSAFRIQSHALRAKSSSSKFSGQHAYLQPLLRQVVIAYLDDILVYSPDLPTHVDLVRQVLDILLRQQFYPKFSKCKFARSELTYLGYTLSVERTRPAVDKISAIKLWPEVLTDEVQVQFLGTVNYCRMFMGPDFATVTLPLVNLIRRGATIQWTEEHTKAVRKLKQRLIDYTILQIPDTSKPFQLYIDASGYAVGAILEQGGRPIGFLSQAMTPTQARYPIYDQELLAIVSALAKWAHLPGVSKVTAFTDHQALTYLQQLKAFKPLRCCTARWLAFLAEFPDLTVTY